MRQQNESTLVKSKIGKARNIKGNITDGNILQEHLEKGPLSKNYTVRGIKFVRKIDEKSVSHCKVQHQNKRVMYVLITSIKLLI